MKNIEIPTKRGIKLEGILYQETINPTNILIVISGIHAKDERNFFYDYIGNTLNKRGNIDFICAHTCDAIKKTTQLNFITGKEETFGSFNEDFNNTEDDIESYINYVEKNDKYKHIYLGGHSLGANKIIYYLSKNHDSRIEKYILISPANIIKLLDSNSKEQLQLIKEYKEQKKDDEIIPFLLFGWYKCNVKSAYDWIYNNILDNIHYEKDADFSQINNITHSGAMIIGTYDRLACGDPVGFLENINNHTKNKDKNKIIFIEKTGHVYQKKDQEIADALLNLILEWENSQ
jgi:alpha/beta superfamily hydrolase